MTPITANLGVVLPKLQQHLMLSLVALILSVVIGLALALWTADDDNRSDWVVGISNLGRTIPSLAVLACAYPILGAGAAPAIVALVALGVPPIVAGTVTSLRSVDADARDAALGLGIDRRTRLYEVELPLAAPGVLGSIRTASTQIIASATLAALIGGGGLGELVMAGLTNLRYDLLVWGAVSVALLALASEGLFALAERRLLPAGIQHAAAVSRGRPQGSRSWAAGDALNQRTWLLLGVMAVAAMGATGMSAVAANSFVSGIGVAGGANVGGPLPTVRIGSKDFTEQVVLAELYAQALEAQGYPVERRLNLGATAVADSALRKGTIDVYPEYTGTALLAVLKQALPAGGGIGPTSSPEELAGRSVYNAAAKGYAARKMTLLEPTPFSNGNAIVVSRKTAAKYKLKTLSDLVKQAPKMRFGAIPGFDTRPDGLPLLKKTYGLKFKKVRSFENGLKYKALSDGTIDAVYGFETDGQIHRDKLVVLQDDRHIWPPYQAAPVVSRSFARSAGPAFATTMNAVSRELDADTMRQLNDQVDAGKEDPADVARAFLQKQGMLKRGRRPKVTIGSKDFTEQIVLAELYAQALEARDFTVERRLNLGATAVADSALRKGTIDMYPEYTGTAVTAVLKQKPKSGSSAEDVWDAAARGYRKRGLRVLAPTEFSNGNAIAVTQETAKRLKLTTLSDLSRHAARMEFGAIAGSDTRADGLPLLRKKYGIKFKSVRTYENGLKYQALKDGKVDAVFGFETDGQIHRSKLVVLEDDRRVWPPYQAAPIITESLAHTTDRDFNDILAAVSRSLDADTMRELNDQVDSEKREPADVARAYLKRINLL